MPDTSQLPFLIKLADDPSPVVWAKIAAEVRAFGPALWPEIAAQGITLTDAQRENLAAMLDVVDVEAFRASWLDWLELDGENAKLEAALSRLAAWQLGGAQPVRVTRLAELLDELAMEFRGSSATCDAESLSRFLFSDKALRGVEAEDYYNPLNSNLIHVIEAGRGIPLSLAAIFMLVGARLEINIYGCNFPGHFLARAHVGGHDLFFDCFNEGRLLAEAETRALRKAAPDAVAKPATAVMIVMRVLANLANAYYQAGDTENTQFVLGLLRDLERSAPA